MSTLLFVGNLQIHDICIFEPRGTLTYGFHYIKMFKQIRNMDTFLEIIINKNNHRFRKIKQRKFRTGIGEDGHRKMMKVRLQNLGHENQYLSKQHEMEVW